MEESVDGLKTSLRKVPAYVVCMLGGVVACRMSTRQPFECKFRRRCSPWVRNASILLPRTNSSSERTKGKGPCHISVCFGGPYSAPPMRFALIQKHMVSLFRDLTDTQAH